MARKKPQKQPEKPAIGPDIADPAKIPNVTMPAYATAAPARATPAPAPPQRPQVDPWSLAVRRGPGPVQDEGPVETIFGAPVRLLIRPDNGKTEVDASDALRIVGGHAVIDVGRIQAAIKRYQLEAYAPVTPDEEPAPPYTDDPSYEA